MATHTQTKLQLRPSMRDVIRWTLFTKGQIHNAEGPVKCRTRSTKRECMFVNVSAFEIISFLLLRMLFPLNNAISSFYTRMLHLSDERLKRKHFLRILHFIWWTEFLRFIFQNSFEGSVSFL